ncbi:MAG: isocitrate lyase/PEP mutase family protein [Lachnospiraceae bacterium]|nr:isocitrate lyase/PEP mutase family protein [Lachnospiraceae bacterium]
MTASEKRILLKEMLLSGETYPVPGVYDAVSARVSEAAGFKAIYLGSFATAASILGLPDTGNVTLTEMANHARNIANATNIPLICDVEAGFFEAANICRTVQEFEQAGVSAIHIEDHAFGKHTSLKPIITDVDTVCSRIRAAVDARTDPNFLIIGRSDTPWATGDIDDAVYRANRYLEAGADAVLLCWRLTGEEAAEQKKRINGPLIILNANGSFADEKKSGASFVLYWPMMLYAAFEGCREAAQILMETGDIKQLGKLNFNEEEFDKCIPFTGYTERVMKYMASSADNSK